MKNNTLGNISLAEINQKISSCDDEYTKNLLIQQRLNIVRDQYSKILHQLQESINNYIHENQEPNLTTHSIISNELKHILPKLVEIEKYYYEETQTDAYPLNDIDFSNFKPSGKFNNIELFVQIYCSLIKKVLEFTGFDYEQTLQLLQEKNNLGNKEEINLENFITTIKENL